MGTEMLVLSIIKHGQDILKPTMQVYIICQLQVLVIQDLLGVLLKN